MNEKQRVGIEDEIALIWKKVARLHLHLAILGLLVFLSTGCLWMTVALMWWMR